MFKKKEKEYAVGTYYFKLSIFITEKIYFWYKEHTNTNKKSDFIMVLSEINTNTKKN